MIDLKLAQKQPDILAQALTDRRSDIDVEEFLVLDKRRRGLLVEVEELKSRRNAASGQVAAIRREGGDISAIQTELGALSDRIKALDAETSQAIPEVGTGRPASVSGFYPFIPGGLPIYFDTV